MVSRRKQSRIAGLIYLVVVITGMFSLAYVPKRLFIDNNPQLTLRNITDNESLFRLSIVSSVVCYVAFIFLPIALNKFLNPVNKLHARLMMLLAIISVPVSFYNLHHKYSILSFINLSKQETAQLNIEVSAQIMMHLDQYENGIFMSTFFWGLWLLPFGYLVYKSGFLPNFLGILLILGCLGYLIGFFGNTLSADFSSLFIAKYIRLLPSVAELSICFWLLVFGANENKIIFNSTI